MYSCRTVESGGEVPVFCPQACFPGLFTWECRGGEEKERRGEDRGGNEGGQHEEEEEELEAFDAMQTGSTKTRRQKFSIRHKNKSARVPALAQSHRKKGQQTEMRRSHSV